eukprot:CAMPEP_0118988982 /NCGR_PEP_ID=MMETSP1173-20130426/47166_1 /TAXON_ID=1034831 /ORGANISM="Rhizochromulina marina cf, Strain CCMP1243" /LENGTH=39 /DNA_ID= /DNA_START= /DNA_END= /DNA_ORIENTATION=
MKGTERRLRGWIVLDAGAELCQGPCHGLTEKVGRDVSMP